MDLRQGIQEAADALQVSPIDLATAISYETAGTFDPLKAGPTTQHGQHRGLIQWGEPQARQYGVDWNNPMASQLGADGAIVRYLRDRGVQPGHGLMEIYSAINAGSVGLNHRTDANNGGAPGTVADKVNNQMGGHRRKATQLFGGTYTPPTPTSTAPTTVDTAPTPAGLVVPHANPTPSYVSQRDERRIQEGAPEVSAWDGLQEAVGSEWAGSWALAQMGGEDFAPDENFQFDDETWKSITADVPTAYHSIFEDAVSLPHAQTLRTRALEMVESDQKLASLGGLGTAMRIGAAVFDPVAIGASLMTDGVAAPLVYGAKISRIRRALVAGASAGAANAGVEGYIASQDPTRGARDVLLAGATGLAVGGALGAFVPTRLDKAMEPPARTMINDITPFEGDPRSMGAAYVGVDPDLSAAQRQLLAAQQDAPRSALGGARIDMVGQLKQSQHPIVRRLAGHLAEDGVGNADGSVLVRSASENITLATKTRMAKFYRAAEPAFKAWVRENNIPMWKRGAYREQFFDEVGRAVRRQADTYTDDVNINKVANEMRSAAADLLQFAKDKNIPGFANVRTNSEYLMRVHNIKRLDEMVEKVGEGQVVRMTARALLNGSKGIDYEDSLKIASAYIKSIRGRKYQDVQLSNVFSGDQADLLEEILKEGGELDAGRIADIVATVRKPQGNTEGDITSAKRRLKMDETYTEIYTDAAGVRHTLGIEDFLDNNAERLMTLYTRQIAGAGFVQDALSNFKTPRLDGEEDGFAPKFQTIVQHIRDTAGDLNMNPSQLDREIDKLELLYKAAMGIPLNKAGRGSEALRFLRDFNFVRVMNQVGFAQIAEIGNILGSAGWTATMQQVPALKNIWKRAQNGHMSDELLDELEVIWGLGTDRLRQTTTNRMDDYGIYEGRGFGALDNGLQKAKQITADISLMAPVNMALQRMAGRAAVQRWMNDALGGKKFSTGRLHAMGVSTEMADRIKSQMLNHVSTEEGMLGRAVKRLNIEEWVDQEAAAAFVNAVDRWSKKIIQENDIGQMSQWMTTDLGKTMVQFRSFMVAAWTKQTLSGVHHRDWDTFMMWSTGMLFAGLSYTAQTYVNSVGRDDQRQYLSDRLNATSLGASAFQRAGFATIIPSATDSVLTFTGFEPVFAYGRSTGLASNAFFGNPTTDLIDKGARAAQGLASAAVQPGYDFSQQDWRALTSLAPFQNAMGIRNILNLVGQELPTWSE